MCTHSVTKYVSSQNRFRSMTKDICHRMTLFFVISHHPSDGQTAFATLADDMGCACGQLTWHYTCQLTWQMTWLLTWLSTWLVTWLLTLLVTRDVHVSLFKRATWHVVISPRVSPLLFLIFVTKQLIESSHINIQNGHRMTQNFITE